MEDRDNVPNAFRLSFLLQGTETDLCSADYKLISNVAKGAE